MPSLTPVTLLSILCVAFRTCTAAITSSSVSSSSFFSPSSRSVHPATFCGHRKDIQDLDREFHHFSVIVGVSGTPV
ncbi:hypothetical protein H4582DRAFT_1967075 [Lactarius indigo]|nr:hypothetical protein H4582DRAFT_1967075 [Lactarius indigo]